MDIPEKLIEQLEQERCIAFIGAGLSTGAGLPSWPALLRELVQRAKRNELLDGALADEIENHIKASDYEVVADQMRTILRGYFHESMEDIFRRHDLEPQKVHRLLRELPFTSIITTNYDKLLESVYPAARVYTQKHTPELALRLRKPCFHILKLHGDIDDIDSLVLSTREYRNLIHKNEGCQEYLRFKFSTNTILFLGYSLTDRDIKNLLEKLDVIFEGSTGTHFALLSEEAAPNLTREALWHNYRTWVISYEATEGHPEVNEFLQNLIERVKQRSQKTELEFPTQQTGSISVSEVQEPIETASPSEITETSDDLEESTPPTVPSYEDTSQQQHKEEHIEATQETYSEEGNHTENDRALSQAHKPNETLGAGPNDLLTFDEWGSLPGLYTNLIAFQIDDKRQEFYDRFRLLTPLDGPKRIRLTGRIGVGKTRLALEAIREFNLQELVVYAATPSITLIPFLTNIVAEDARDAIVIIVDNCNWDYAQELWQYIQFSNANILLLTIETISEFYAHSLDKETFYLQPLPHNKIKEVVEDVYAMNEASLFNDDKAVYSDEYVQGNLALLISLISTFQLHPDVMGIAELTNFEELRHSLDRLLPVEQLALRTLYGLSVVDGVALSDHTTYEAEEIARLMGLSLAEFKQSTHYLQTLGLVTEVDDFMRDRNHRYVVPKLLAIRLAMHVWLARGDDIIQEHILVDQTIAKAKNFRYRLLTRLGDLGLRKVARSVVNSLLSHFDGFDKVAADPQLFGQLLEAEPISALHHLWRLMDDVSLEQLQNFTERRPIIHALDSLLRLRETFDDAAYLLARFAAAENETWGNNATGVFKSAFFIRLGGNPASAEKRLQTIRELLHAPEDGIRLVAIMAIEQSLNNYESGIVRRGPGGYITPQSWVPKTWSEFWELRRNILVLLEEGIHDRSNLVSTAAKTCLINFARHQIPALLEETLDILKTLTDDNLYKVKVWKALQSMLKYDGDKLDIEAKEKIEALGSQVITDRYHDQLLIWVSDVDYNLRRDFDNFEEFNGLVQSKIYALVEEGFKTPEVLRDELPWLASLSTEHPSRNFDFMYQLGAIDKNHEWYEQLLAYASQNGNWQVIQAYLLGQIK